MMSMSIYVQKLKKYGVAPDHVQPVRVQPSSCKISSFQNIPQNSSLLRTPYTQLAYASSILPFCLWCDTSLNHMTFVFVQKSEEITNRNSNKTNLKNRFKFVQWMSFTVFSYSFHCNSYTSTIYNNVQSSTLFLRILNSFLHLTFVCYL